MPPTRTTSDTVSRRLPFKAPSRVSGDNSTTAKSKGKAPAKNAARSSKKKTAGQSILISDEEEDHLSEDDIDSDVEIAAGAANRRTTTSSRINAPSTPRRHSTTALAAAEDDPVALLEDELDEVTIPRALLARILHQGFDDKSMRIGKEPMGIMELYTKLFVKEALARSKQEAIAKDGGDSTGTHWLQVEDLEKIAPQLMLDF